MSAHDHHDVGRPVEDWDEAPVEIPMKQPGEKPSWIMSKRGVRVLTIALVAACVLSVLADLLYHKHLHPGEIGKWEKLFGFFGFYGFLSCVSLVLLAKILRLIVMRKEDYYDE